LPSPRRGGYDRHYQTRYSFLVLRVRREIVWPRRRFTHPIRPTFRTT
jgi:hypothetical protein